jgi:hypothetical protein
MLVLLTASTAIPGARASTTQATDKSAACDQLAVRSPRSGQQIDIASIRITSDDCKVFRATLTTHRPFTDSELGRWVLLFGEFGGTRGCDGMTRAIVVDGRTSGFDAQSLSLFGCRSIDVSEGGRARVVRNGPGSITVTFGDLYGPSPFRDIRWQSVAFNREGTENDVAPRFAEVGWTGSEATALPEVSSTQDGTALEVDWTPSASSARQRASGAVVQYRTGGGAWRSVPPVPPWETYTQIPNVTLGLRYQVRVALVYNGRVGRWTTRSHVHLAPPGAPRNLRSSVDGSTVTVTFDPPATTGGHDVLRYSCWASLSNVPGSTVPCNDLSAEFDLADHLPFTVTVSARGSNATGRAPWATIRITG